MRIGSSSRFLIAPNAYKGGLHCFQVAQAIAEGIRRVLPRALIEELPVADGGDCTLDVLVRALGGQTFECRVTGPLGSPVIARWGGLADERTAVIESAEASGLRLVPSNRRDPWPATSFGTGELIAAALDRGYRRLIIGVGGTATVDGGAGLLQALGAALLDAQSHPIGVGGGALRALASLDFQRLDRRLREAEILVACDVDNPICGPRGAAPSFGPQKGADPAMVRELDSNLERLIALLSDHVGRDLRLLPMGGAAGGMGAALLAAAAAHLQPGIDLILELLNFDAHVSACDLVITGEGTLDATSWGGKGPIGVAAAAHRRGVPCVAIVGQNDDVPGSQQSGIFDTVISLVTADVPPEVAMRDAYPLLARAAEQLARSLALTRPSS